MEAKESRSQEENVYRVGERSTSTYKPKFKQFQPRTKSKSSPLGNPQCDKRVFVVETKVIWHTSA